MSKGFYIFFVGAMQEILSGQVKTDPSCLFKMSPIRAQELINEQNLEHLIKSPCSVYLM